MASDVNYGEFAEETDNLRGAITGTMHAVMKATGMNFNDAHRLFHSLAKLGDSVQMTAHRLWWEADGEFYCSECATVCTEPWRGSDKRYSGEIAGEAPSICRPCQAAINRDAEATNRMNCVGTPYQY